ncbi:MAG: peroxiredoxin family protein, partial [Gemmata sp.]
MRASAALLLSAALSALVGCGSSVGPPPYTPPTAEELKVVASGFHNKEANREVADGQLPLKFLDMEGKTVDLADYKGTSNVLLVVVKGLPQKTTGQFKGQFCPGCLAQVNALVANYDKFKAKNTEVVMVFPGPTESVGKFLADGHVS